MAHKPETNPNNLSPTPAPGVSVDSKDSPELTDNTSLTDVNIRVPIVSGPNGNQGGN
jgi:hypothetical protein